MTIKINDIKILISFPLICVLSLIVICNLSYSYLYCVLAILLHETGHIFFMCVTGCKPKEISLYPLEIRIIKNDSIKQKFSHSLLIAFGGPLFNLIVYAVFIFLNLNFAYVNLFLGLFNLLPCQALDGGQILFLILSKHFSLEAVNTIIAILTVLIFLPLFTLGILILFDSGYNFSLLFISLYLLMSLLLKNEKSL